MLMLKNMNAIKAHRGIGTVGARTEYRAPASNWVVYANADVKKNCKKVIMRPRESISQCLRVTTMSLDTYRCLVQIWTRCISMGTDTIVSDVNLT